MPCGWNLEKILGDASDREDCVRETESESENGFFAAGVEFGFGRAIAGCGLRVAVNAFVTLVFF